MQRQCRQARRDAGPQAGRGVAQQVLAQIDELVDEGVMSLFGLAQLVGEFALVQQDGEDPALLLVAGQGADGLDRQVAQGDQGLQRLLLIAAAQAARSSAQAAGGSD